MGRTCGFRLGRSKTQTLDGSVTSHAAAAAAAALQLRSSGLRASAPTLRWPFPRLLDAIAFRPLPRALACCGSSAPSAVRHLRACGSNVFLRGRLEGRASVDWRLLGIGGDLAEMNRRWRDGRGEMRASCVGAMESMASRRP
uniref:Uncharacterized protein n=1 Tax=Oryza nivara TaxID=4536 RepID=A0A0E0J6A9_ORYNI